MAGNDLGVASGPAVPVGVVAGRHRHHRRHLQPAAEAVPDVEAVPGPLEDSVPETVGVLEENRHRRRLRRRFR